MLLIDKMIEFAKQDFQKNNPEIERFSVDSWRIVKHTDTTITVSVRIRGSVYNGSIFDVWVKNDLQCTKMEVV